ncbi:hypothetical protein INS49_002074 [Diaporthe citri]|uniref:uncharacterized protein n=1 Tax=Diaporthe citri TaxID=83186 RepID=UPI001C7FF2D0|nr:uncharacterized protein INS49_002074 [Diaporthe citri]KAG6367875.1 hypothetical protein INS49_002074 [Diaporthe citri]
MADSSGQQVYLPNLVLTLASLVQQTVAAMRMFFSSTLDVGLDGNETEGDPTPEPKKLGRKRKAKAKKEKEDKHKNIEVTKIDEVLKLVFNFLILDEAHYAKAEASKATRFVNSIQARMRVLSTATPLNHPRDIISYVKLGVLEASPDLSFLEKFVPRKMDLRLIYDDGIDPYHLTGSKGYTDVYGVEHPVDTNVTKTFLVKDSNDPVMQQLCRLYDKEGFAWWK